jgi:hypothetical protein
MFPKGFDSSDIASDVIKHTKSWKDDLNYIKASKTDASSVNFGPTKKKIARTMLGKFRGKQLLKQARHHQYATTESDENNEFDEDYEVDYYVVKALRAGHLDIAKQIALESEHSGFSQYILIEYLDQMANNGVRDSDLFNLHWLFSNFHSLLSMWDIDDDAGVSDTVFMVCNILEINISNRLRISQGNEQIYAQGLKYVLKLARRFKLLNNRIKQALEKLIKTARLHQFSKIKNVAKEALRKGPIKRESVTGNSRK